MNGPWWITGIGVTSCLGNDYDTFAERLIAGQSGIARVEGFSVDEHPCQIAGQAKLPTNVMRYGIPGLSQHDFAQLPPTTQCAFWCAGQALRDAGLWPTRSQLRVGVVLGVGAECMLAWDDDARRGGEQLYRPAEGESLIDGLLRLFELSGPGITLAAACASANHAMAHARRWLELGWVDICLTGGCDMGVTPCSLATFGNLRALSRRNDTPEQALRPFDRDRDGMVLGEGGALFVLESANSARQRGRKAYAELSGVGLTSDAYHLVIPSGDPVQGVAAMQAALTQAKVEPADIDYINAHATGTPVGDVCETRILRSVLKDAVRSTFVSSTKSMTGHLLSAAAAVEAAASIVAIERGIIPPTINLEQPDPECGLRHVALRAIEHRVRVAVSNSFGFGGHNTSLVLKAVE